MITRKNLEFLSKYGSSKHLDQIMNSDHEIDSSIMSNIAFNRNHSEDLARIAINSNVYGSRGIFLSFGKVPSDVQENIVKKKFDLPSNSGVFGDSTRRDFYSLLHNPNLHHSVLDDVSNKLTEKDVGYLDVIMKHPNLHEKSKQKLKEKFAHLIDK